MRRKPVASFGLAPRHLALAALLALAAAPSCGGGGGNQTAKFVGPWTFSAGTLTPMCPLAGLTVPSFNLMGLNVTFQEVDGSTISLTLNTSCVVKFKVSGSKATVAPNQTCSLDVGAPLGMVNIDITTWTLSLVGGHIDCTIDGSAAGLCTAMGTATLVPGTTDAGVLGGGGHGGGGHGGAGAGGSAGVG
ncbi:MAG TPA: hypothetical protein VHL80_13030, partial [Polyangia bacterium]|nr:hypothetical protein [Polyangia bacterium]